MKKQCGKFIKKDSNILKVASVKDFSFEDIATTPIITYDNKERSLIHTNLHSSKVIDGIVNPENRCDIDLIDTANERGLLWPVDFTQEVISGEEYHNLCKNYKDYESNETNNQSPDSIKYERLVPENAIEDDDGFTTFTTSSQNQSNESADNVTEEKENLEASTDTTTTYDTEDNNESVDNNDNEKEQNEDGFSSLDFTSKDTKLDQESSIEEKLDTVLEAEKYLNKDLSQSLKKEDEDKSSSEFERGYSVAKEELSKNLEHEKAKINETITLITDNFKNIIDGLSGLKKSILDSANKNFYEISQAVSENLLKKEFSLNPESFISVINKALSNIDNNNIKVKVSHNMYEKLNSIDSKVSANLKGILEEDLKIADGDFKIESDINAIDGSIHSIVTKLLDEYDLNLFQKEETKEKKVEQQQVVEEELNKVS